MFGIDTQSSSHVELQSQDNNSVPPGWQVARPLMMFSSSLLSWCTVVLILLAWGWLSKAEDAAVHLTLHRRGGRFATHDAANLTRLAAVLGEVELRYARTERIVEGNRLGRQWKSRNTGTTNDDDLIASVGHDGRWFHNLHMSDPKQTVELEIDMLSPDFYVSTTTSGRGSQYNAFVTSHISNGDRVHPLCQHPTDLFHLSTTPGSPPTLTNLTFSMCSPSHSHTLTLSRSGATLGLSPPNTQLSRLTSPPLLTQFHNLNLTPRRIWSLTLLTPSTGLLTLGASIATHIERARLSTSLSLENFGNPLFTPSHISSLIDAQMKDSFPHALEDQFHWVKMSGPRGLWTTLMSGVWIGGSKVLKNQPVLLDVNCPFILAPRLAVRRYYESIGGAQRISLPRSEENEWSARTRERKRETRFWKIPCLNEASVAWEFGGKMFGAFKEGRREDGLYGPAGGAMSLGKYVHEDGAGNGYCVGVVVESRMGVGGDEDSPWRNSGMRDVWVLGEPFFRGLGVVFDAETEGGRIGLRNY